MGPVAVRVGWLEDQPGYVGGAELTARDLRAAKPDHVAIIDCPPGNVQPGLEAYIVHNCMFYRPDEKPDGKVIRFVHDQRGPGPIDSPHRIFYTPLQRDWLKLDGELCPAPLGPEFHSNGNERDGAVTVGTFGHHGKGQRLLTEWAAANGPLAVYGHGPLIPQGPNIDYRGPLEPEQIPTVLQHAQQFVHLPTTIESYGRGVAEAWACGTDLVINRNVGCMYWLHRNPGALRTAASRFWEIVNAF